MCLPEEQEGTYNMNSFKHLYERLQEVHLTPDEQEVADLSKKYGFGSVAWQKGMEDRIMRKLNNKEPLSSLDTEFINTQSAHNKRLARAVQNRRIPPFSPKFGEMN